jgi:hypothetical protein
VRELSPQKTWLGKLKQFLDDVEMDAIFDMLYMYSSFRMHLFDKPEHCKDYENFN